MITSKIIIQKNYHYFTYCLVLICIALFSTNMVCAEDGKTATITLKMEHSDSTNICTATVMSADQPVVGTELHFYVKSLFALLPIGSTVETDSSGIATANFPMNLPGDKNGNYTVVVKIEDDDNYGTVEANTVVKWGIGPPKESSTWNSRSLSASREKAPMYLIISSILIITAVWGTIFYIILQIINIKKASKLI